jgi:chromosome segregation ATPase
MKSALQSLLGVFEAAVLTDGQQLTAARTSVTEWLRQLRDLQRQIAICRERRLDCRGRLILGGAGGLISRLGLEEARCTARLQVLSERHAELSEQLQAARTKVCALEAVVADQLAKSRSLRRVIERQASDAMQRGHSRHEAEILEHAVLRCTDSGHPV